MTITEREHLAVSRWRVGPRVWRVGGEWRLRLYRPWHRRRLVEAQSKSFPLTLYTLGVGAGWWKS